MGLSSEGTCSLKGSLPLLRTCIIHPGPTSPRAVLCPCQQSHTPGTAVREPLRPTQGLSQPRRLPALSGQDTKRAGGSHAGCSRATNVSVTSPHQNGQQKASRHRDKARQGQLRVPGARAACITNRRSRFCGFRPAWSGAQPAPNRHSLQPAPRAPFLSAPSSIKRPPPSNLL